MVKPSSTFGLHAVAIALALASGQSLNPAWAQQVVGVVGAANATPTGKAPGKPQRMLKAGSDIYFKDRIVTKRGGSAQLAFLDRSTLVVSENSDLVIDEFVYRPGAAGTMTARLSKGVMRFVGGDISHEGGATVKTPVVTIGIRGGIGTIGYVENAKDLGAIPGMPESFHGGAIVVNGYGTMTVHNGTSEMVISRPGFAVFVGGANEAIAAPVRFDVASAKAMMSAFASRPGQRGGLSPKAAAAVSRNIGLTPLAVPVAPTRVSSVNALDFTSIFHVGNALARNRSQTQQTIRLQTQIVTMPNSIMPISTVPGTAPTQGRTGTRPNGGETSFDSNLSGLTGRRSPSGPLPPGPMPPGPMRPGPMPPRPMPAGPMEARPMPGEPSRAGRPPGPMGGPIEHSNGPRGGFDNGIGNGGRNNGNGNGGNQSGKGNGRGDG